jgi:hypothetical protein
VSESDPKRAINKENDVELFLHYVSDMLERADFLIPLVAAQRQFREDNYQMASAAQLEDLFHDALGMFLRENHPRVTVSRRSGNELWDYAVAGTKFSHKESQSAGFAVWWTGGNNVGGKYLPRRATWDYEYPIVFVYTALSGSLDWEIQAGKRPSGGGIESSGRFTGSLGLKAIKKSSSGVGKDALVMATPIGPDTLRVERVWPAGTWEDADFHSMWPELGGPGLAARDLWLDKQPKRGGSGLVALGPRAKGAHIKFTQTPLLPGIYVFTNDELQSIPLVANNRAHSAAPEFVQTLMRRAATAGRFIPFPLWFAHFAEAAPPNLYGQQRAQFETLFAPRSRG